jgi:hypothetical protein
MRCYNAAMGKPFQFSMRRIFLATWWLSVSAAAFCALAKNINDPFGGRQGGIVLFCIAMSSGFAGIGAIFGKSIVAATCGFVIAVLIIAILYCGGGGWI